MVPFSPRILGAAIAAAVLAGCGGGAGSHAVPAAKSPQRSAFSFDALPKGAPRPLAQMDGLAHVARDSSTQINLSPDALARLTAGLKFVRGPQLAQHGRTRQNITTESPSEHGNIGTEITGNYAGIYATQSGWQGFKIANGTVNGSTDPLGQPTSNTVFADTTKEPYGCFESGSGYWSNLAAFYVFDFCRRSGGQPGTFVVVKPFNGAWYQYTNNYADGTQTYTIQNYRTTDGVDHALIFNVQQNQWEELATEAAGADNGGYNIGWSFTEYYNEPAQAGAPGGGAGGPGYCQPIGFSGATDDAYRAVTATAYALDYNSYTLENLSLYNSFFLDTNNHGSTSSCLITHQDGKFPAYDFYYDNYTVDQVTSTWQVMAGGGF